MFGFNPRLRAWFPLALVILAIAFLFESPAPLSAAIPSVTINPTSVNVGESGPTSNTYSVVLETAPSATVNISISSDSQVTVNSTSLTFTTSDWGTPQYVTVTAKDDALVEGAHIGTVSHSATSDDSDYNGITIANVTANITDNDVAQTGPAFVVNRADDHDDTFCTTEDCTLREAINAANSNSGTDTLTFNIPDTGAECSSNNVCTITLSALDTLPAINDDVTIDGSANSGKITVDGAGAYRILTINSGKVVTINALTLANGNCSSCDGGGINNSGTLNLTNSTLNGNDAFSFAGGIYNTGTLNVTNSTLHNNDANAGGGIYNTGTVNITNSTFAENDAWLGRSILNSSGSVTLRNTIVAASSSSCSGGVSADAYNLDTDGTCDNATTKSSAELNLGTLADNGGHTPTIALLFASAALETGDSTVCANAIGAPNFGAGGLDQRGITRPQSVSCDVGAFEQDQVQLKIADVSLDEGNAGTTAFDFTVSLNIPAGAGGVTFDIATADDTATTADNDYQTESLTNQTISAGSTVYTFTVQVNGDTTFETDESFYVNVTNVTGATLSDGQGQGNILDDDAQQSGPNFVVNSAADTDDSACDAAGYGSGNYDCTLREAINAANALSGADTITFNIPDMTGCTAANVCTITVGSQLPNIDGDVTIDGSQNSAAITINGNNFKRPLYLNSGKTLSLDTLTIMNGKPLDSSGGAIFNNGGTLNANHITFSGNNVSCIRTCGIFGGAIFNTNSGTANIVNSTFVGNTANNDGKGGAIYNNAGTLTVTNSSFNNNSSANDGGAIANANGTVYIINSTISGNSADSALGGVSTIGASATTVIKNSIIANNSGGDCANTGGTLTADAFNLDTDGTCDIATTKTAAEIDLQTLADNGGPTQTMALGNSSAAIDAGDPTVCAATIGSPNYGAGGFDQRGEARADLQCDSGTFELQHPDSSSVTVPYDTNNTPRSFGPALAIITPTAGAPITFTITMTETAFTNPAPPTNAVPVQWDATASTSPFSIIVTLCYLPGVNPSGLHVYHYNGNTWDDLGGVVDATTFAPLACVTATTPLTSLSPLALAPITSTATDVTGVKASVNAKEQPVVQWRTLSEARIGGFNVWRQTAPKNGAGKGEWKQINAQFKQAKYAGQPLGNKYRHTDKTVKSGKTYRYKVEIVYLDGHTEWTQAVRVKMK